MAHPGFLLNNVLQFSWLWYVCCCLSLLVSARVAKGQSADSLKTVNHVYVASLGSYDGADELRHELIRSLKKKGFAIVTSASQADALLDGKGELWVRGYHSLSPRARKNSSYAEPVYDGYLSVKLHGKDNEILWSYFADPRRATFHSLRRDLVDEVVTRLRKEVNEDNSPPTPAQTANDVPVTIKGAGATFPFPIYEDWFKSFRNRHPAWSLEYAPVRSEEGIARPPQVNSISQERTSFQPLFRIVFRRTAILFLRWAARLF